MAVTAIQPPSLEPSTAAVAVSTNADAGFAGLVTQGLSSVDTQLKAGQSDLQRLAAGESVGLHQVMIDLEQGRMSFELLMQVRNRVLQAYQDLMHMQV